MALHPTVFREKLSQAIKNEDVQQVAALVADGGDVNQPNGDGSFPLESAIWRDPPQSEQMVEILLKAGANANVIKEEYGEVEFPLKSAVESGTLKTVKMLLEAGADPNLAGKDGTTALMWAAEEHKTKFAKLLIDHGADVNALDVRGRTALLIAGKSKRAAKFRELLEQAGALPTESLKPRRKFGAPAKTAGRVRERLTGPAPTPPQGSGIAQQRGVISFDYNNEVIFAEADVEQISQVLIDEFEASDWQQDVAGREVNLGEQWCLVVQLRGHAWSMVLHGQSVMNARTQAAKLSQKLHTPALQYAISDTAAVLVYAVYEDGQWLEVFESTEGGTDFDSSVRDLDVVSESGNEDFVNDTLCRLGLLEPSIQVRHLVGRKPKAGQKVVINALDDVERVDYLSMPKAGFLPKIDFKAAYKAAAAARPKAKPRVAEPKPFSDTLMKSSTGPVKSRRGVESMEADQIVLLAKTPIDRMAANLAEQLGMTAHKADDAANLADDAIGGVVFQLSGSDWVLAIEKNLNASCNQVLKVLTRDLSCEGLLLAVRAELGEVAYRWMADGSCLEQMESLDERRDPDAFYKTFSQDVSTEPDLPQVQFRRCAFDAGDNEGRQVYFHSLENGFGENFALTAEKFVSTTIAGHKAYVPRADYSSLVDLATGKVDATGSLSRTDIADFYLLECNPDERQSDQISEADQTRLTAELSVAIRDGERDRVKSLLAQGADPNALVKLTRKSFLDRTNYECMTMLGLAAKLEHLEIIEMLLEHGAEINLVAPDKDPALFWAISFGKQAAFELLLKCGADPNIVCEGLHGKGTVPLINAAAFEQFGMVKQLIERGADLHAVDSLGANALFCAVYAAGEANSRVTEADIQYLLDAGIDPNHPNQLGTTALMLAADAKLDSLVKLLLKGGSDPSLKNNDGKTARDYYKPKREFDDLIALSTKSPVKKKPTKKKTVGKSPTSNKAAKKKAAPKKPAKKTAAKKKKR